MPYETQFQVLVDGEFVNVRVSLTDAELQPFLNAIVAKAARAHIESVLRAGGAGMDDNLVYNYIFKLSDYQRGAVKDEVETEALALAEADIVAELAKDGLPPPRSISDHARALIQTNKLYFDRARQRLIARAQVAQELLAESLD
jgi:hypothetical protein